MALEQSLNKEYGKFKQLYTNEGALQKYYLTAHRKAEVTKNMKMISGFLGTYRDEFKEATAERIKKDESAIEKVISVVEERMQLKMRSNHLLTLQHQELQALKFRMT